MNDKVIVAKVAWPGVAKGDVLRSGLLEGKWRTNNGIQSWSHEEMEECQDLWEFADCPPDDKQLADVVLYERLQWGFPQGDGVWWCAPSRFFMLIPASASFSEKKWFARGRLKDTMPSKAPPTQKEVAEQGFVVDGEWEWRVPRVGDVVLIESYGLGQMLAASGNGIERWCAKGYKRQPVPAEQGPSVEHSHESLLEAMKEWAAVPEPSVEDRKYSELAQAVEKLQQDPRFIWETLRAQIVEEVLGIIGYHNEDIPFVTDRLSDIEARLAKVEGGQA